jgi:hypothetical protein
MLAKRIDPLGELWPRTAARAELILPTAKTVSIISAEV